MKNKYIPTEKEKEFFVKTLKKFKEAQKNHRENCPICNGYDVFKNGFKITYASTSK